MYTETPVRIIPMRVGTSGFAPALLTDLEDHPHACGDKFTSVKVCFADGGSSPCVWGQAPLMLGLTILHRIIPMRVGTRSCEVSDEKENQDHPHACGDKKWHKAPIQASKGSSPCVWGQELQNCSTVGRRGIIPMRVGTRASHTRSYPA